MKALYLKSTVALVLMAVIGSAAATPPPPPLPIPSLKFPVINYNNVSYVAVGSWPGDSRHESKELAAQRQISFSSDGTPLEYRLFQLRVQDDKGNACSAEAKGNHSLSVKSNPANSAHWVCVSDGKTLKVLPLSE